jgi:hypothetical protein
MRCGPLGPRTPVSQFWTVRSLAPVSLANRFTACFELPTSRARARAITAGYSAQISEPLRNFLLFFGNIFRVSKTKITERRHRIEGAAFMSTMSWE